MVLALWLTRPAAASRFAIGWQRESWLGVDLDETRNPGKDPTSEPGMAQTEANEVEARNRAIPSTDSPKS